MTIKAPLLLLKMSGERQRASKSFFFSACIGISSYNASLFSILKAHAVVFFLVEFETFLFHL